LLVDSYYQLKNENGYSKEQIEEKRKSLAGVLVPVTSEWNKELLHQAGFAKVETFWRMLNFEGYIAIKG
jgi:tRNA (cmo5U34)-methyltransferase